jgi:hypothetical protein
MIRFSLAGICPAARTPIYIHVIPSLTSFHRFYSLLIMMSLSPVDSDFIDGIAITHWS